MMDEDRIEFFESRRKRKYRRGYRKRVEFRKTPAGK